MRLLFLVVVAAFLAGCGGGGTGSSAGSSVPARAAKVDIGALAASPLTILYGVQFTLHLPAGVTVAADSSTGELSPGVLQATDSAALAGGRFQAAASGHGSVLVIIVDPVGFTAGPLASVACSVASGATPQNSEFTVDGFSALDASGNPLPGVTPFLTIRTQ